MSVLIKGMEMPKEDGLLSINIWPNGNVTIAMDLECKPVAKAVELPEHGDLISRDDAIRILERIRDHCENYDMSFALNWAAQTIRDLTVVVPAEREGET